MKKLIFGISIIAALTAANRASATTYILYGHSPSYHNGVVLCAGGTPICAKIESSIGVFPDVPVGTIVDVQVFDDGNLVNEQSGAFVSGTITHKQDGSTELDFTLE